MAEAGWHPDPQTPGRLRYWDGQQWTEHTAPAYAPQNLAPPKSRTRFVLPLLACLATAIVAVVIAAAVGSKDDNKPHGPGISHSSNSKHPPQDDVTVTTCATDDEGSISIKGHILNHSSKQSNYIISIGVDDSAGTKIGEGVAAVDDVAPGQKAIFDASSGDEAPKGAFTCKVTSVDRLAS